MVKQTRSSASSFVRLSDVGYPAMYLLTQFPQMPIGNESANYRVTSADLKKYAATRMGLNVVMQSFSIRNGKINSALIDKDEIHCGMGDTTRSIRSFISSSCSRLHVESVDDALIRAAENKSRPS